LEGRCARDDSAGGNEHDVWAGSAGYVGGNAESSGEGGGEVVAGIDASLYFNTSRADCTMAAPLQGAAIFSSQSEMVVVEALEQRTHFAATPLSAYYPLAAGSQWVYHIVDDGQRQQCGRPTAT